MTINETEPKDIERAYFHIENGGLSIAIEEQVFVRENCPVFPPDWHEGLRSGKYKPQGSDAPTPLATETRHNRYWYLKLSQTHFGAGTSYRFPLTPLMVRWGIEALSRVLARMQAPQERPSDREAPYGLDKDYCSLSAKNGVSVSEHWPYEPKFSSNEP